MTPLTEMLIDLTSSYPDVGRWLVIGGEPALIAAVADDSERSVTWIPTDFRDRVPAAALAAVEIIDDVMATFDDRPPFDVVVIPIPQARNLARRWLVLAANAGEGGRAVVAGGNQAGIRTAVRDATVLFGAPIDQRYGKRHRGAAFRIAPLGQDSPAWISEPGIAARSLGSFKLSTRGLDLELQTLPGVFSVGRLDEGTALLMDHLEVAPGARVLDVGCGCGVIAIVAAALGAGAVDLVDTNPLAVATAAVNVAGDPRLRVFASDVYGAVDDTRYDLIVSNPPFHQGKDLDGSVAARLIDDAPSHLRPGGRLVVVANAFLAYGTQMERGFGKVETIAANGRYHVIAGSDPR